MKIRTERGIENLNVKPCNRCGKLKPPLLFFKTEFNEMICDDCFKEYEVKRIGLKKF